MTNNTENSLQDVNNRSVKEHLLEQFNNHLLDMACHEYNVFYLNHTDIMLECGYYQIWENEIMSVIDQNLNKFKKIP